MEWIWPLLHWREKYGELYDEDDRCFSYYFKEGSVDGLSPNSRRLMRCPRFRALRASKDAHSSRVPLNNEGDHASEDAHSSRVPLNNEGDHASQFAFSASNVNPASQGSPQCWRTRSVPASRAKQFPKKSQDYEGHSSGLHMGGLLDIGNAMPAEGDSYISSLFSPSTKNCQSYSPCLKLPGFPALRTGGQAHESSDAGIPSYHIMKQSDSSGPNERISSFLSSLDEDSRIHRDSWLRTSDQPIYGDRVPADEFATEKHNHNPKSHLENRSISKHIGYPSRDSQAIGSPIVASPPLSTSSARAVSPGGWIKGKLLGSGSFGRVYKGLHSDTGEFCAMKEVEFVQSDLMSRESAEQLKKEVAYLSSFKHPNIVQYKGSELMGDNLYIYLELVSGGSLYNVYQEFNKFEEPIIRRYTRQILLGLAYLHGRNFVHRDIKCANILVDQDGRIKLADFGVAKYIEEQGEPFSLKGSPQWMAPEVIWSRNTGHEYAVDIWSLGCTVIEMVMGQPPWGAREPVAALFKIFTRIAPPIPDTLSAEGKSFVRLCLQKNPAARPTATALLEHPFVKMQSEVPHAVHAFETINNELEHRGVSLADLVPSARGANPFSSAPSSPRSSYNLMDNNQCSSTPSSPRSWYGVVDYFGF